MRPHVIDPSYCFVRPSLAANLRWYPDKSSNPVDTHCKVPRYEHIVYTGYNNTRSRFPPPSQDLKATGGEKLITENNYPGATNNLNYMSNTRQAHSKRSQPLFFHDNRRHLVSVVQRPLAARLPSNVVQSSSHNKRGARATEHIKYHKGKQPRTTQYHPGSDPSHFPSPVADCRDVLS